MSLKPLHDNVIIKPLAKEQTTASGIVLPDTLDKEKPEQGEVIAVGPGKVGKDGGRVAMSVTVGQKVMFKKYAPDEIKVDGQELFVVAESDIIAVVE